MIDRRRFLSGAAAAAANGLVLGLLPLHARPARAALSSRHTTALADSPYVYISPLKSDGHESRCHAELWYAWLDEAVVVIVSSDRWKARAVAKGLDRARIWVGDYGRGGEAFRAAPNFEARAERRQDDALLDRLLAEYERKYPKEIGRWRERMRKDHADGSRVLIRYRPQ